MLGCSHMPCDPQDLIVSDMGQASHPSPLNPEDTAFVSDDQRILCRANAEEIPGWHQRGIDPPSYEAAGPREKIFYNPSGLTCGIVTCGGLCPGLNDVIRTICLTLFWQYDVERVLGFRYGYEGLSSNARALPLELTPDGVDNIQHLGGTVLGSSRGPQDPADMVEILARHNVSVLFVIGGDGTFRGAHALAAEIKKQQLSISVIGVPKTIDNDICHTEMTFGYSTSIEEARRVLTQAHTEAKAAWNGVGLVKLMGRDSGFIAAGASLASTDANKCLIPEAPVVLDGPDGLLPWLQQRLARKHHAVIAVAEGAGQDLMADDSQALRDASGNLLHQDIGVFLRDKIKSYFKSIEMPVSVKYFDPSYSIRSCPANARDSVFCLMLGQFAVHAGMAGKTDMFVGFWNQHFTHVPLVAAIGKRKKIEFDSRLWQTIRTTIR